MDESSKIDFGISSLATRLPNGDALTKLNAPSVNAPVMLPAHVDCWSQTEPEPMPTPDVAPFLRGPARGAADVQLCWRADIDLRTPDAEEASKDTLTLCPPAAAECMPVPIGAFKRWMKRQESDDQTADVESSADEENERRAERSVDATRVLRWRGRKDIEVTDDPEAIRPGDTIVLPTYVEGRENLGDLPHRADIRPTLDWGDRAHRQSRAKAQMRLHPYVVDEWPKCVTKARFLQLTIEAQARYDEDPDALADELRDAFTSLANDERAAHWLREIASALGKERRLRRCIKLHPLVGLIVQGNRRLPATSEDPDLFSDEDDAAASGTVRVPLFEHLPGVAAYAKRFAAGCGLPNPLIDAIERAGLLHDLGKADPRFQALLRNGNPWVGDVLLAKSSDIPQGRSSYRRALEAAGYPDGGRHELLSVRLVENVTGLLPDDEILRDSILHLVASHHGYCRPFAPVVFDEEPRSVTLEFNGQTLIHSSDTGMERLDSGVADRFWRLVRHYGWWGLAWLEAILRLADHRRSEAEAALKEDASDAST